MGTHHRLKVVPLVFAKALQPCRHAHYDGSGENCMPIRGLLLDILHGQHSTRSGLVDDDHGLPHIPPHHDADRARKDVAAAARAVSDHDLYGSFRITLGFLLSE